MSRVIQSMSRAAAATAAIVVSENVHDLSSLKSLVVMKSQVSGKLAAECRRRGLSAFGGDGTSARWTSGDRETSKGDDARRQDAAYVEQGRKSMDVAWQLANSGGDWRKEAGVDEERGVVYSTRDPHYGKVFKLVADLDISAEAIYRDIVDNPEQSVSWNPTLLHLRVLRRLEQLNTDVCYAVAEKGAGGLVSSRDFVYVRHWKQKDGWYSTSCRSIDYQEQPPVYDGGAAGGRQNFSGEIIRGENGPSCMRFKPLSPDRCRIEWLCNTNLKGWLPQRLTDRALSGVQLSFLAALRGHCARLKAGRN